MRALTKFVTGFVLALSAGAAAQANTTVCADAPLLIQDVTIVDASGSWDHQDIFIEQGRISAIGEGLMLETAQAVTVMHRPGSIVRPRSQAPASTGAIFIRTSTGASGSASARRTILMPGVPADLVVYAAQSDDVIMDQVELEISEGRILGAPLTCQG
ncbi:hypothetical protein [Maricaulis parjimensis]|uniref:hypothetical protein n=1 Tax=Maricaulis parjimensis TaxID=144023 RepID=UPI00193991CF|nr:hypothetical protein [Maricaulis parjimensis]